VKDEWRTIDSCPDQKWVLAWAPEHGTLVVKKVEPNGRGGEHGDFVWATPENDHAGYWAEDLVTHWMPLPEPPKDQPHE
jgi:hypothetical protein